MGGGILVVLLCALLARARARPFEGCGVSSVIAMTTHCTPTAFRRRSVLLLATGYHRPPTGVADSAHHLPLSQHALLATDAWRARQLDREELQLLFPGHAAATTAVFVRGKPKVTFPRYV